MTMARAGMGLSAIVNQLLEEPDGDVLWEGMGMLASAFAHPLRRTSWSDGEAQALTRHRAAAAGR